MRAEPSRPAKRPAFFLRLVQLLGFPRHDGLRAREYRQAQSAYLCPVLLRSRLGSSARLKLDPAAKAGQLRALGYRAAAVAAEKDKKKSTVDPKDKIEVANRFHRALTNLGEDRYDEATADLREVVRMEPDVGPANSSWVGLSRSETSIQTRCRCCARRPQERRSREWLIMSWPSR